MENEAGDLLGHTPHARAPFVLAGHAALIPTHQASFHGRGHHAGDDLGAIDGDNGIVLRYCATKIAIPETRQLGACPFDGSVVSRNVEDCARGVCTGETATHVVCFATKSVT